MGEKANIRHGHATIDSSLHDHTINISMAMYTVLDIVQCKDFESWILFGVWLGHRKDSEAANCIVLLFCFTLVVFNTNLINVYFLS